MECPPRPWHMVSVWGPGAKPRAGPAPAGPAPLFPLIVSLSDRPRGALRALQTPLCSNWKSLWNEVQYLIWPVFDRSCVHGSQSSPRARDTGGFLAWAQGGLVEKMSHSIKADWP